MENNIAPSPLKDDEPPRPAEQLRGLLGDVKALAGAEIDYAKARLGYSGGILRKAGILAVISLVLMSSALIALILGLLLITITFVGPIAATALVVGISALGAILFGLAARNTARNLTFKEPLDDA
ncbi:phage holin family protein [Sphingorhabdus sp.]|uniref:phage holin family protein n=1 Tax=Sphingorhabdus sp. TaxID=1902408 RepID=UPI003BAFF56E